MESADKTALFKEWLKSKKAEDTAKKKRIEIEVQLESLYGNFEGKSKTIKEEELGFSINVKKNVAFKLDQEKYIAIRSSIPDALRPEKITFSIDETGFKFLKEKEEYKDIYLKVSDCVEEKVNKSTIKVEKL